MRCRVSVATALPTHCVTNTRRLQASARPRRSHVQRKDLITKAGCRPAHAQGALPRHLELCCRPAHAHLTLCCRSAYAQGALPRHRELGCQPSPPLRRRGRRPRRVLRDALRAAVDRQHGVDAAARVGPPRRLWRARGAGAEHGHCAARRLRCGLPPLPVLGGSVAQEVLEQSTVTVPRGVYGATSPVGALEGVGGPDNSSTALCLLHRRARGAGAEHGHCAATSCLQAPAEVCVLPQRKHTPPLLSLIHI